MAGSLISPNRELYRQAAAISQHPWPKCPVLFVQKWFLQVSRRSLCVVVLVAAPLALPLVSEAESQLFVTYRGILGEHTAIAHLLPGSEVLFRFGPATAGSSMEATSGRIIIKIYRNNVHLETKQYADPPKRAGDIIDRLRDIQRVGDLRHGDLSLSALDMLESSAIYELHLDEAGAMNLTYPVCIAGCFNHVSPLYALRPQCTYHR